MSLTALTVMAVLFFCETAAFARSRIVASIAVDENVEPQIRLNFNITLADLHCDYVSVDVWDALGTNRQNVTRNVDKWQLDSAGAKRIFSGRNRDSRELGWEQHDVTLEEMHAEQGGAQAVVLTKDTFADFLKAHEMAFIDLYAPWYVYTPTYSRACFFFFCTVVLCQFWGFACRAGKSLTLAHSTLSNKPTRFRFATCPWNATGLFTLAR
jgi:hypothetical protein